MSSTPSTSPSSKLPFSNSVTGTGAVLLGPLASFHSGAVRGRSAPMAERYDAATTTILSASCCNSSALSRATVLPSSCCVASPYLTPQPSSSVLAAFCPLTSEAWRSGTMRCGALADEDTSSGEGSTTADNSLQSSLVLSSDWSQRGSLAAAHDTPLSPVSLSGQYLISTADDTNHADDTENNGSSLTSEKYTARRLSAPKAFMPLYPVQSPAPFTPCFAYSPLSGDSLSTPPAAPALERGTARDLSTTPAVSSHLPSEPWQQHSLLMSPLLHSLPLPFVSPKLGCIAGSEETQSQFSRHRTPVSAHFEHLARMSSNEVKSRGLPPTSFLITAASPAKHKDDMRVRLIASPLQRLPLNPLSSDEGSCSPLFTALVSEDPAPLPRATLCSEGARHGGVCTKLAPLNPSETARTEESFSGAGGASTAGSSVENLRCFSLAAEDARSIESPLSMAKQPSRVDRALGSYPFPAIASGNGGKENQRGEDINRRISFAPPPEGLHSVIAHCPSVEQLRDSVNASSNFIQFSGRGAVPLQKRRFSLPQNVTLKIKRRGSV